MSEIHNSSNYTGPNKDPQSNTSKRSTIIITSVVVAVLAVIGGVTFYLTGVSDSATSQATDSMDSQSSMEGGSTVDSDPLTPAVPEPIDPRGFDPINELPQEEAEAVESGRQEFFTYTAQEPTFTPVQYVESTQRVQPESVAEIKRQITEELGASEAPTIDIEEDSQKLRIQVEYSSIGDKNFTNGTMWIKLTDGLRLIPGTIIDSNGGEELTVADSVYNEETNLIKYGPGSGDQETSEISVGQRGTITFDVELTDENINQFLIMSYLKDADGEIGKPGNLFIEV